MLCIRETKDLNCDPLGLRLLIEVYNFNKFNQLVYWRKSQARWHFKPVLNQSPKHKVLRQSTDPWTQPGEIEKN